jgi:hypothetical protein
MKGGAIKKNIEDKKHTILLSIKILNNLYEKKLIKKNDIRDQAPKY